MQETVSQKSKILVLIVIFKITVVCETCGMANTVSQHQLIIKIVNS